MPLNTRFEPPRVFGLSVLPFLFRGLRNRRIMQSMKAETMSPTTEAAIWTRVIHPDGELSPQTARAVLKLEFDDHDQERAHELALKAQEGTLTPEEQYEIDNYERVGTLLAILKSKARKVLKRTPRRHL